MCEKIVLINFFTGVELVLILILLGLCYFFRKGKEKMGYEDHKKWIKK